MTILFLSLHLHFTFSEKFAVLFWSKYFIKLSSTSTLAIIRNTFFEKFDKFLKIDKLHQKTELLHICTIFDLHIKCGKCSESHNPVPFDSHYLKKKNIFYCNIICSVSYLSFIFSFFVLLQLLLNISFSFFILLPFCVLCILCSVFCLYPPSPLLSPVTNNTIKVSSSPVASTNLLIMVSMAGSATTKALRNSTH